MPNPENLKPFKRGYDPKREGNGRPAKLISSLKVEGYKMTQVVDTISKVLSMSEKELNFIKADKAGSYSILEKIIAGSLLHDLKMNRLNTVEILLDRGYGKATIKIDSVIPEQPLFPDIIGNRKEAI